MGKLLRLLIIILSVLLVISGCNTEITTPEESTAMSSRETRDFTPTSTNIKVAWLQQYWETREDLQYIFDEFNRKHPGYTLEINYNLGETSRLLAEIQSNNQPDLYLGADPNWATYVTGAYQRLFQPLTEYLTYDEEYNFDTVPENLLDTTKFYPDGRHYAVPYALAGFCLAYNRTLFDKAGLDPDTPPETWSQWLDFNDRLIMTDSTGVVEQIGIRWGAPYGYIIHPLRKHDVFSEDGLSSRYNESWVTEDQLFTSKFAEKYNNILPSGVEFSFLNGNVGMDENTNIFDLSSLTTSGIDFDIALLPRPDDFDERVVPALLWMYISIPTGAKNPNGGWLFAKFANTDGRLKAMEIRATQNPNNFTPAYIIHTPTRERAYNLYMNRVDEKTRRIIEKRDELVESINYIIPYPPIQNKKSLIHDRWGERYRLGEVTLAGMNEGIHNEMEQELSRWKEEMSAQGWNFPEDGKPFFRR